MKNLTLDKESYEKMFNLTSEALCAFHFNGELKYANSTFFGILGYNSDETNKLNMLSIIHPDDKDILRDIIIKGKEEENVIKLKFRVKCNQGDFKWGVWNVKFQWNKKIAYAASGDISNCMYRSQTVNESHMKFNTIIDNISGALFISDRGGNYTKFNKLAREIYTSDFYDFCDFTKVGDSFKTGKYHDVSGNLVKYNDIPAVRMLRGEKILGFRVKKVTNDAEIFYDINANPIYDNKGNVVAGVQCWHNVTEAVLNEQVLQDQYDFLYKIIDNMDLPFIRLSCVDFTITDINQKALNKIRGINNKINSIDVVKGKKYTDIINWLDKDETFNQFKIIKEKKKTSYQKCNEIIVHGEKMFVNILYQPMFGLGGEIEEIIVIIMDITKEIQAKLELEKNMKMQEEFFLNISHEFKTPLNVVYTTIQLLDLYIKDGSLIDNQNNLHKYINIIKQNCYRQIKLVNNLIDLSKMQSGIFNLHLSNHNIVSIVESTVQSVAEYIETKGLRIVFDTNIEGKFIACDSSNIERVVLNLISNAIKFSEVGDEILVQVLDKGDIIEISVKDTGIGINEMDLEKIFQRFKQVDKSISRNTEGSGVGLSIVKSIIELHGGNVKVKSKIDKGSEFIIELPSQTLEVPLPKKENIKNKIETINIEFSDIYL